VITGAGLPVAVAAGYVTVAPQRPGALFTVILAGQLIVGALFTISVAVIGAPTQPLAVGMIVYVTVCCTVVLLIGVPLIGLPVPELAIPVTLVVLVLVQL
jgi:hypothetical protein